MSAEAFELPFSFPSRDEAFEWLENNHPEYSIFCFDNPDGTVGAILEPPEDLCDHCNQSPCVLVENQEQFQGLLELYTSYSDMSNRQRRFKMYQEMTRLIHGGYLGKGNRKQLPQCVTDRIQDAFPNNLKEEYVGFKEAETKNTV